MLIIQTRASHALAGLCCLIGVFAQSEASACNQWKAPSGFLAQQANGFEVIFQLKQDGSKLYGKASYKTTKRTVIGNVAGGIANNRFAVKAYWTYSGVSSIGNYTGEINSQGLVSGKTYDEYARPPAFVSWYSRQKFSC
jgi:hypothetical protein